MYIFALVIDADGTHRGEWRQFSPTCQNHVYRKQSWDQNGKEWVDDVNGQLRLVDTVDALPSPAKERNGYEGTFPSQSLCDYINRLKGGNNKEGFVYFDDGERLVYGGQKSRWVKPDNANPIHPIKHPPRGFSIVKDDESETGWAVEYRRNLSESQFFKPVEGYQKTRL